MRDPFVVVGIEHQEIPMTKDSGSESKRKRVKPSPGSTKGSILRAKITPAPPEMLERLKNWHVFSRSGSSQPIEDSPTKV